MLAFKDGTLASYDSTKVMRPSGKATGNSRSEGQEIAFFKALHNVATHAARNPAGGLESVIEESGVTSVGITGAAFLPGYRSRAVTVGADGKCKVVDFEKNQIVRTWHVRGPATCLSIFSPSQAKRKAGVQRQPTAINGTSNTVLAIGRIDGKVVLFDSAGVKLRDLPVDDTAGRVVDVEWVKGTGPKILGDSAEVQFTSETWIELFTVGGTLRSRKSEMSGDSSKLSRQESQENHEENIPPLPPHNPVGSAESTTRSPDASHDPKSGPLDDVDIEQPTLDMFSTVKHNELEGPVHRDLPLVSNNDYMDLFSPVKRTTQRQPTPPRPSPPKRRMTPRSRPRLSSSTFIYQGSSSPQPNYRALVDSSPTKSESNKSTTAPSKPAERKPSSPPKKKSIVSKSVHDPYISPVLRGTTNPTPFSHSRGITPASISSSSSANSKVLADLRRFGEKGAFGKNNTDNRAILAPYMPSRPRKVSTRRPSVGGRSAARSKILPIAPPAPMKNKNNEHTTTGDDIWLTAESDVDDDPPKSSPDVGSKPATSGHQRKVSWQESRIWDDDEEGFARKPQHALVLKQPIEIKLAPPRTKTRSTFSEPIERIEKTDFNKRYRGYDPSPSPPLTNLGSHSSSPAAQRISTHRRESRSAPTAREVEETNYVRSEPFSPRGRLDSAAELPPGFAHSFHGPVPVASYLPRKGSLAFVPSPASSPTKSVPQGGKTVLGEVSGNGQKDGCQHLRKGSPGVESPGTVVCDGCEELGVEVMRLRDEVDMLRRMLKRKDGRVW